MNDPTFNSDYSDSILSIFDIGGVLFQKELMRKSNGLQEDFQNLLNDQKKLEKDYKIASERVFQDLLQDLHKD